MSIKLVLDSRDRDWYTGGDKLSGTVLLTLSKDTTIHSVVVSIYGISYTHLEKKIEGTTITGGGGCVEQETEYAIVLDELVQVFPSGALNLNTAYTLPSGAHKFPFEVTLPLYAMPQGTIGSKARQAQILPPSCSDQGEQMVQYFIKAKAIRDGNWGTSINTHQFFIFLPSDDADLDPSPCVARAKGILEKAWWNISGSAAKSCNSHRWELKGKPTATPRINYEPELWVSFLVQESLEIQSIELKLETITFAKARNLKETFTHSTQLYKSKPNLKIACDLHNKVKIPIDLRIMIPDKIPPNFVTANMRRSYQLVCVIKYQHQKAVAPKHSVGLRLPIQVMSGISTPHWETGHVFLEIDRTFPMNSFYYTHRDRGIAIV